MYYSKILMDLSRQEKNPVNKMYLSEISLKWKSFQQLTEGTSATNQELAEALSQFLASLHNRKFIFN
jgi:flagellar capping protein FliD